MFCDHSEKNICFWCFGIILGDSIVCDCDYNNEFEWLRLYEINFSVLIYLSRVLYKSYNRPTTV